MSFLIYRLTLINNMYYLLFTICIISRLLTSIYYIEDIDSLRFAYSIVEEFNILKFQPHFPGYAVFCFIANLLYSLIGNLGFTFSLIGGISTFCIIYYSLQLLNLKLTSKEGIFLSLFILFNPMIWLMGNRYMPDLMGLAIFIISFYYLSQKNKKEILIGALFIGILTGIRISYLPLLLVSFLLIFKNSKYKLSFLCSILFGISLWLIPMIAITGLEEFFIIGLKHIKGHFTEYGGTIITESSWQMRLKYFFHTIWSDGMGGYWNNRSLITMILSILFFPIIMLTIKNFKFIITNNYIIKNIFFSITPYLIWILLFQNIIYKSRHIMPIVLFLILFFSIIYNNYISNKKNTNILYMLLLFSTMSYITINLCLQHKQPNAIKKTTQYLQKQNDPITIISIPLINFYLKSQNVKAKYIEIENNYNILKINEKNKIFIVGNFSEKFTDLKIVSDTLFHHNPYVNRMWSTINIYSNKEL